MTTKLIMAESARNLLKVTAKEEEKKKQWNTSNECNIFSQKHFGIFCQFKPFSSCNFILRFTFRKENLFTTENYTKYISGICIFFSNKKPNESLQYK